MLRQLRRKFVLISMLLVTAVLLVTSVINILSFRKQLADDSKDALYGAIHWKESGFDHWQVGPPPSEDIQPGHRNIVPALRVTLSPSGAIALDSNADISDDVLTAAVDLALNQPDDLGFLKEYNLRYLREQEGEIIRIAFVDAVWEFNDLSRHVATSLLMAAIALACFFVTALVLARWATRPIERSWEQQQQFIADASHELKAPITVLLADADILLAHPEDSIGNQKKWVEYMKAEAARMKSLVDDMLFLVQSGSVAERELERLPVPFSDLCWNGVLSFEALAFEQGEQLTGSVENDVVVIGDERQLERLITILLDNACKYCGHGGTAALALARSGDRAVLTVSNTGTPIPKEAMPHLFERFYRVDTARSRETGGHGLGLSIAASIVQQHHGKISVTSTAETGTVFTVSLPVE